MQATETKRVQKKRRRKKINKKILKQRAQMKITMTRMMVSEEVVLGWACYERA
jgi:hypothetical protein